MKTFHASYSQSWGWGAYQEYEYIIVANTQAEALGLALEARMDTLAEHWTFEEIPMDKAEAHYISDRGN